jgi:uroporphyrinogen-III decarboxylase
LKTENPRKLVDALDMITRSEIHHAKRALKTGASGILLSVANANAQEMTLEDYRKFSAPFDRRILAAIPDAPLNILHLHVEAPYLDTFRDFPPILNYSLAMSGIRIETVRSRFRQVIAGVLDEVHYRALDRSALQAQWKSLGPPQEPSFILTPGCSVPNDSRPDELSRQPQLLGA